MSRRWSFRILVPALFLIGRFGMAQAAPWDIEAPKACTSTATVLCLNNRFLVSFAWLVHEQDLGGFATAVALTSDTGYFWFNSANNVELVIKAVDGRAFNNFFWVFFGALTNVEYLITVTDTVTGRVKTYFSQQGTVRSVSDTAAFNASAGPPPNANVSGIWDAVGDNRGDPSSGLVLTLSQTGTSVSGTFSIVDDPSVTGAITGTVSGQSVSVTAIASSAGGSCSTSGTLFVVPDNSIMRGVFPDNHCNEGGGITILTAAKR